MASNELYIIGCGGHARSVADVALSNNPNLNIVFVDENARANEKIWGFSVVEKLIGKNKIVHFAIGANDLRKKKFNEIHSKTSVTIIAKTAQLGKNSKTKDGCFVAHKAYIGPDAKIGVCSIINTASVIEHEVEIGDFCHVAPNAIICGRCKVGDNVFIGAGAVVKDNINICSNVVIGAGAVVINDIYKVGVYIGVPAKIKES